MQFGNGKSAAIRKRALTCLVISVVAFALTADLKAGSDRTSSKAATTNLHISVIVIPVLQAVAVAPSTRSTKAINFDLQTPARQQTYEIRVLPPDKSTGTNAAPVVLKTLVIVPQ